MGASASCPVSQHARRETIAHALPVRGIGGIVRQHCFFGEDASYQASSGQKISREIPDAWIVNEKSGEDQKITCVHGMTDKAIGARDDGASIGGRDPETAAQYRFRPNG